MYKNTLLVGIISLFFFSAVVPLSTGLDTETVKVDVELERMIDALHFICTSPGVFNSVKYEYYNEQLLNQYSFEILNNDVFWQEENKLAISTEPLSITITSLSSPMDSAWSMKCHDIRHTGRSPHQTIETYAEKWRFKCGWLEDTPVIDNNGIIYFGCNDRNLYAVYPNGTLKWKYKAGGIFLGSSPAISNDGTIYIGSWDTGLYAINPDGTKKWRFGSGGSIASSPVIGDDDTIYCGHVNGDIFAMNPNGTRKWRYKTENNIYSDPCIGDDGTIYIGSDDTYLYALNPDGTLKWRFKTGEFIKAPPSIADDGTVYIGSYDDYLYALYPNNGSMKWKCKIGYGTALNPSFASDGTIYCGWDRLYAVNPNGTIKWIFDLGENRHIDTSSPAISAEGTIYFGTNIGDAKGGEIIVVNPNGTEKWRKKIADEWVESSPSIAEDGTIYIGSSSLVSGDDFGYLHAFGPQETNYPPNEPSITGSTEGKVDIEYDFTFIATDPDRNPVSFYIEWGDGETTGWTMDYNTGEKVTYSHTWSKRGNFIIKAKAKDTFGLESDWGTLIVTIPREKATNNMMLLRLLERLPFLQKLLYIM